MKHEVSNSDQLLEGHALAVEADGQSVLLVRSSAGLFALENACPHQRSSLEQCEVLSHTIRCPWHGVEVNLADGSIADDAGFHGLENIQVFNVEESEGVIYLET